MSITAQHILTFWFEEISANQHWIKDAAFDRQIEQRFTDVLSAAQCGELWQWRTNDDGSACALGRLAEIIVLDQFPRNIYRDTGKSFSCDAQALTLSQEAVAHNCLLQLSAAQQAFLIMPYMHSESAVVHKQAVALFESIGDADKLRFELRHKEIIDRFGRYPHRNKILQRTSSADEIEFLQQPGSGF